ncbi:MAG TPA: hypothetical protein VFR24_11565 [Candidatus Angelobacter sp.]|nr:hypothetical protein [Candidatus Angelobacter sp.]
MSFFAVAIIAANCVHSCSPTLARLHFSQDRANRAPGNSSASIALSSTNLEIAIIDFLISPPIWIAGLFFVAKHLFIVLVLRFYLLEEGHHGRTAARR